MAKFANTKELVTMTTGIPTILSVNMALYHVLDAVHEDYVGISSAR